MRCVLRDSAVERSSKLGCGPASRATCSTIAALTARDDSEIEPLLGDRGVPLYRRGAADDSEESIMGFLADHLRPKL